jgi:hypothetical protein
MSALCCAFGCVSLHADGESLWCMGQLKKTGLGGIFELVASPAPASHGPLPPPATRAPLHPSEDTPADDSPPPIASHPVVSFQQLQEDTAQPDKAEAEEQQTAAEKAQMHTYACVGEHVSGSADGARCEQVVQGHTAKARGQKNLAKLRAAVALTGPGLHANARIEERKMREEAER